MSFKRLFEKFMFNRGMFHVKHSSVFVLEKRLNIPLTGENIPLAHFVFTS